MSKGSRSNLIVSSFLVALASVVSLSCGSSGSSSGDLVALCNQGCDRSAQCFADAGPFAQQATAQCKASCMSQSAMPTTSCTNQAVVVAAAKVCLAKTDCNEFLACLDTIPDCQGGGSGTGGSAGGGTGGSAGGGTGGSAGGGDAGASSGCSACDKNPACCVAYFTSISQPTTACGDLNTASCNATPSGAQSAIIQACTSVVTIGASANIAACK